MARVKHKNRDELARELALMAGIRGEIGNLAYVNREHLVKLCNQLAKAKGIDFHGTLLLNDEK
jgi:hypothetical protein